MLETGFYSLVVNLSGEFVFADNPRLAVYFAKQESNNLFDYVLSTSNTIIEDIITDVKKGDVIDLSVEKQVFNTLFPFQAYKFSPLFDGNGETTGITILLTGINNDKRKALQNENRFEQLFNSTCDAIFVTDTEGSFLEVNQTAIERTGFDKKTFLRLNIKDTPTKSSNQTFINYFQELLVFGKSTAQINYVHKDGDIVETEISGSKFVFEGTEAFLHISRDVADRVTISTQNFDSIIQAEEKERSKFAYEIREVIGPNLSLLKMYLEAYFSIEDVDERNNIAKKIKGIVDGSLGSITEISDKISPRILTNLGFRVAMEVFVKKRSQASKINYTFKLEIPNRIPNNVAIVLYRAVDELLNNLEKHSSASNVFMIAGLEGSSMVFEIEDDGVGFKIDAVLADKRKRGILNIVNKIKSIKGTIDFVSKKGQGTKVKIEIPISQLSDDVL